MSEYQGTSNPAPAAAFEQDGIAQQVQAALEADGLTPRGWVEIQDILHKHAAHIDEFAWDVQVTVVDYLNSLCTIGVPPDILKPVILAAIDFVSFINPRETLLLAGSRVSTASTSATAAFLLQQLSSAVLAISQSKKGLSPSNVIDVCKAIQALCFGSLETAGRLWQISEVTTTIGMAYAVTDIVTQLVTAMTRTESPDMPIVENVSSLSVHGAATWLALLRSAIKSCYSTDDEQSSYLLSQFIENICGKLSCDPYRLDWVRLSDSAFQASHFGLFDGDDIAGVICSLAWFDGPSTVASNNSNTKKQKSLEGPIAVDSDGDEAEEEGAHAILVKWRFSRSAAGTLRSGIAHFLCFLCTNMLANPVMLDIVGATRETSILEAARRESPYDTIIGMPQILDRAYAAQRFMPAFQQITAEHAAAVSALAIGAAQGERGDPQSSSPHLAKCFFDACLNHYGAVWSQLPNASLPIVNNSILMHHTLGTTKRSEDPTETASPLELFFLQALLTSLVRDPRPQSRQMILVSAQHYLRSLRNWAAFFLALFLVESCPFPAITCFILDAARQRTRPAAAGDDNKISFSPHHLAKLAIMAIDVRMKAGLVSPTAVTLAGTKWSPKEMGQYLSEHADIDIAILSILRLLCLQVKSGAVKLGQAGSTHGFQSLQPLAAANFQEFRDLYARPLMKAISQCEQTYRESAGILVLHEHAHPFAAVEPKARGATLTTTDSQLSKLFLLDAAITPALEALEDLTAAHKPTDVTPPE